MILSLASILLAVAAENPAAAVPAPKGAADLDALVANPPFGSGAAATSAAAVPAANLELRGMYQDGGRTFFSLYNTTTKQSRWVAKDEVAADPTLPTFKSYDPETGTLTVEVNGKPSQVAMKSATVAKYEPPREPAPAAEAPRGGPPLPEPGPDGKVQTPWGSFTPEQIAAYRAEREKRWQERMQQVQTEGGDPRRSREAEPANGNAERGGRSERGGRPSR